MSYQLMFKGLLKQQIVNRNVVATVSNIQRKSLHDIAFSPKLGGKEAKVSIRKGSGGRSTTNEQVATVFGCTGFLGRYVVSKLARRGTQVVVPYRGLEDDKRHLKVAGDLGQIVPMEFDVRNYDQVLECVQHSDVVVNLVGRNWETRNFTFDDVHVKGAQSIAKACAEVGVGRLIHVSALNANVNSKSGYFASKARGEEVVLAEYPEATIVRPSTLHGPEDYFLNRIGFTKNLHLTANHAQQTLRPVSAIDVALAIDLIARENHAFNGKIFELVGPKQYTFAEILKMASHVLKEDIRTLNLPLPIFTAISKVMSIYPYRKLYPDEVVRLTIDDKLTKGTLRFSDLNIQPQSLEQCILTVLRSFRSPMFYELGYDAERKRTSTATSTSTPSAESSGIGSRL